MRTASEFATTPKIQERRVMHCPFCQVEETKVIDSRLNPEGLQVRRRRECTSCKERFNTIEKAELNMPMVIKRDGRRKEFNIDNLRSGMLRALEKRPVSIDTVEQAINDIVKKIRSCGEREILTEQIGAWVMDALYSLDQVAYVRFASVYKRFQDVSEFNDAIAKISELRI